MPSPEQLARLLALNELWFALRGLLQAQADLALAEPDGGPLSLPPGATSGLLAPRLKTGRVGWYATWQLDTTILRQLRQPEVMAARYRGEADFICRCRGRARRGEPSDPRSPSLRPAIRSIENVCRRHERERRLGIAA